MTSNQSQSIDYRKEALQQAVAILEQFTYRYLPSSTHSKSIELIVQDNRLVATSQNFWKKLMNGLLFIFSSKARRKWLQRKQAVQKTVLNAIDTVKSHHLLLTKLHAGSIEDQQLAQHTLEAIQRYNIALQKKKKITLAATMSQFFYKYDRSLEESHPIELPSISWLSSKSSEEQEATETCSAVIPALSHEVDLIRLKASTLLRQHGVQLSTAETVKSLQAAPIQAILNPNSKTSTLCLTLQVLPGTTIKVRGSFKRENAHASAPIPNSFKLSVNTTCNGFPIPSQYAGWSLGDHLIPSYPHHLDQLPLFAPLYRKKKEIMAGLLPNGSLVSQAQQLYALKQKAFTENKNTFLKLHEQLAVAIHRAGEAPIDSVNSLFSYLKTQQQPFSLLEQIYQMLYNHCIALPNATLEQIWLTKNETDLRQENSKTLQQTIRKQLEEQYSKPINFVALPEETHPFILSMSEMIGPAAGTILMQLWSETFKCPPPMLNYFEQKLQAAVFAQQRIFQEELCWSMENAALFNVNFLKQHMESYLKQDIALFKATSFGTLQTPETALVDELEDYFNSRYFIK